MPTNPAPALPAATRSADSAEPRTHFGFGEVRLAEKQERVNAVFRSVAARYDIMNDLMSAGLHRAWKAALVARLRPPRGERPFAVLDVAGGTGDIAFRILDAGGRGTAVTVLDINPAMLAVGRERGAARRHAGRIAFMAGNAEALPFADASFDAYTIAFGIRNVTRMERALAEAHRVLRRGGRFLCLEFAPVVTPGLDRLYDAYSFKVIPRLGEAVTGDRESYRYLVESIRRFPLPEAFAGLVEDAGFRRVEHSPYSGGVAHLHAAWKL